MTREVSKLDLTTEADLQSQVIDLARLYGWRLVHFRPGMSRGHRWSTPMSGDPGWPDLVLVRPPRLVFAELKSMAGKTTAGQEAWLAALAGCGPNVQAFVWRPDQLEEIEAVLRPDRPPRLV